MAAKLTLWMRVNGDYIKVVEERGAATPFPGVQLELLNRVPKPLRERFLTLRKRAAARLLAAHEEDEDVVEMYKKHYGEVQICDEQVDSGKKTVRKVKVGKSYMQPLLSSATPLPDVPEELLNRVPEPLRERFVTLSKRAAARLLAARVEDQDVLKEYQKKYYAEIEIYGEQTAMKVKVEENYVKLLEKRGAATPFPARSKRMSSVCSRRRATPMWRSATR